ncbi:MAG TPA: S8 family serine peptidase [Candidatus Gemmiger faecigallinarum]|nr:S8 family serine peptidase [Candidatus Gemmiger faecigallinarum]
MKKTKRCLAAVLAGLLAVSLLPGSALAEGEDAAGRQVTAEEVETQSLLSPDNLRQPIAEQNVYDDDAVITAIVEFDAPAVMDYFGTSTYAVPEEGVSAGQAVSEFLASEDAQQTAQQLLDDQQGIIDQITALTGAAGIATMDLEGSSPNGIVARWSTLVNAMAIQVPYGTLEQIRQLDGVKRAYVQHVYDRPIDELDTDGETPWYSYSYDKVDVQEAWQAGYTGKGMLVAVLDTGLDINWGAAYDAEGNMVMGVTRSHEAFRDNSFLNDPNSETEGWELRYDSDRLAAFLENNMLNSTTGPDNDGDGNPDKIVWDDNGLYKNLKVPYACDYADGDLNVQPASNEHGTHVSGTVAGYAESAEGEVLFSGVAPDAQIMMMKVFSDQDGGAMEATVVNALEDALRLGADVINLSLGSDNGFSEDDTMQNEVYATIEEAGIALMTSAGNSGYSSASNNYGGNPLTSDVDTSMMSSPAIYDSNISVASLDNTIQVQSYMTWEDAEGVSHDVGFSDPWTVAMKATFGGQSVPVYLVGGVGSYNDYSAVGWATEYNPDGKTGFALVPRGEISFADKVTNGQYFSYVDRNNVRHGVLGVIVYDTDPNSTELINMSVENTTLTCAFINGQDGAALAAALQDEQNVSLTVSEDDMSLPNPTDGQMSVFSSWGAGPSLELKPEITAPGGNIWSTIIDTVNTDTDGYTGSYGMMSGTSMAAPHMSGIAALVRQRVLEEDSFNDLDTGKVDNVISQLLVSTAIPQKDPDGNFYSPRQQGAGLVNAYNALTTPAYISVEGQNVGKLELKDDPDRTGSYNVAFDVNNISDQPVTYNVSITLLKPMTAAVDGRNTMLHQDETIKTVDLGTVTVEANSTANFSQTVTLTEEEKAALDATFENGVYVEGFVSLTDAAGSAPALGLPMLAFYGDWTSAAIFDASDWLDDPQDGSNVFNNESTWGVSLLGSASINPSTGEILGYMNLGQNPFDPASATDQNVYNGENITISPNGDQYFDRVDDYILYQLRDAKAIVVRVTDAETGEVYFSDWTSYIPRTVYNSTYGVPMPITAQYYGVVPIWEGTDQEGNPLPSGTKCTYEVIAYGDGDYGDPIYEESTGLNVTDFDSLAAGTLTPTFNGHEMDMTGDVISFPVTVDTTAPSLENHTVTIYEEDGRVYMTGTVNEDESSLAYVQILPYVTRSYQDGIGDPNYAEVGVDRNNPFLTEYFYNPATHTYNFKADITSYAHTNESYPGEGNTYKFEWTGNVMVSCGDYGANERSYSIKVDSTSGLVLSQTSALLHPGSTFDLSVIDNTGLEGDIIRTSSNPEVATIDELGKVTAVAAGQTIIEVSKGTAKATCVVAVEDYNTTVVDFDLVPVSFDGLKPDGQLLVRVDNLQPADVQLNEIRWEVFEDEDYLQYGEGLLSVEQYSSDGLSGSIYMTVNATQEGVVLPAGTGYLNVTLNGVTRTMNLSWPELPTSPDQDDLISGANMGDQVLYTTPGQPVDLIASYRNQSDHDVNDVINNLENLQLDGPDFFSVNGSYSCRLVNDEGYALPAAEDVHVYTRYVYEDGTYYDSEMVNYPAYTQYTYDPQTGELNILHTPVGTSNQLVIEAAGVASEGAPAGEMSGQTWTRPDGLYGPFTWTVTEGSGALTETTTDISGRQVPIAQYTPSEPGVSTITATSKDGLYSVNFAVVSQGVLAETIDLPQEQHNLSLDRGETFQLTPALSPEPTLEEDKAVIYTSFDENVATVDENGVVTALNPGQAYIKVASAADNTVITYCLVTVEAGTNSVKFVDYDGTVLKQVWVANGMNAEAPEAPYREGYTFTGWDGSWENVTEDRVLTAQYTINHYTVSFVVDGQVVATVDKEHGQTLTSADYPAVPEKAGYTGAWKVVTDPVTGDISIEAVYTPISTGGGNTGTSGNDNIQDNPPPSGSGSGASGSTTPNGSTAAQGSAQAEARNTVPETADALPLTAILALLAVSGACLILLAARRRKGR